MTTQDIPLGMVLKGQAGWNQIAKDWQRFLELEPEGCFVAEWKGQAVGTTTTCCFGVVGWIAMVLVDESYRHRGIATALVQRGLEYLVEQSVTTVRLDATMYGRPVYERMGFVAEHDLVRLQGTADGEAIAAKALSIDAGHIDLDLVSELDRRATNTERRRLLERLLREGVDCACVGTYQQGNSGYVVLRPGANATQIGPAVATTDEAGRALCNWAMSRCLGQPVFIDVPIENRPAIEWASARGLVEQRQFTRMFRGQPIEEDVALLWASSGPEKG